MFYHYYRSTLSFFLTLVVVCLGSGPEEEFIFDVIQARLPKPISDNTATLVDNRFVYIAGGCDSRLGNEFVATEGYFECSSVSDALYVFDITMETFDATVRTLPRVRFRHAAALVRNQLWLIGGRDNNNTNIAEIDVYDIASGSWSTYTGINQTYVVSDTAGFGEGDYAYVVGGFDQDFNASNVIFRVNTVTSTTTNIVVEHVATLLEARGDVSLTHDANYAYISGGFTDANGWCVALGTVERFNIQTFAIDSLAPLVRARADKALAILNNRLFALGGEDQFEDVCNRSEVIPSQQSLAIDDIEVFEDGEWEVVGDLPNHRFRFSSVAVESTRKVYTFGGQSMFNATCNCFPTTDEIVVYTEEEKDDDDDDDKNSTKPPGNGESSAWSFHVAKGHFLFPIAIGMMVFA